MSRGGEPIAWMNLLAADGGAEDRTVDVVIAQTETVEHTAQAHAAGAELGAAAQAHGAHASQVVDQYMIPHEVPNFVTLIQSAMEPRMEMHDGVRPHTGTQWYVNPIFTITYALLIVLIARLALRRASVERPGKLQNAVEAVMGGLRRFFVGVMGPQGERFVPFVGCLFLLIWLNNVAVLVPGLKAPSSSFKFTFALGLATFGYVQYHALRENGLKRYVYHLMAEPKDVITWCLAPLFLVLEIISELIKPVSLSLRLFGNIFGEDKLLAIFLGLGIMLATLIPGLEKPIIGVPLHLPFFFLVLLLSTIQALVFSVLAAIYILLLLPHEEHAEESTEPNPTGHEQLAQNMAEGQAGP